MVCYRSDLILGKFMRFHFNSTAIKLSSAVTIGLLSCGIPTSAQAITYQQVIRTGQNIPGSNTGVSDIGAIGIDQSQNIAATIGTANERVGPDFDPYAYSQRFQGVYQFRPATAPQLIEGGLTYGNRDGNQSISFGDLSINDGNIAYFVTSSSNTRFSQDYGRTELKMATGSGVSALATANVYPMGLMTRMQTNTIANNQSTAFFLGQQYIVGSPPTQSGLLSVNTPNNFIPTISSNHPIFSAEPLDLVNGANIFRTNPDRVLLVTQSDTTYRVIEQPSNGEPREIERGSKSCGAAMWNANIVFCGIEATSDNPYRLMVRIAPNRAFQSIQVPPNVAISQPSIQSRTVIFRGTKGDRDTIYLSFNAQRAQPIVSTGNTLNGKVISRLRLSDQGQSINGKAIVFVATFTDGSSALYRATL
jgi:hypothetical protein